MVLMEKDDGYDLLEDVQLYMLMRVPLVVRGDFNLYLELLTNHRSLVSVVQERPPSYSIQFSFIYIAPNYNNCHLKALK